MKRTRWGMLGCVALSAVLLCEILWSAIQARIPRESGGATDMTWILVSSNRVKLANLENNNGIIIRIQDGTNFLKVGFSRATLIRCGGIRMLFNGDVSHASTQLYSGDWRDSAASR